MKKLFPIIIIVFTSFLIFFISFNNKNHKKELDKSMFNIIKDNQAIKLFEDKKTSFILLCRDSCEVCRKYIPILQIAIADYKFSVNYIRIEDLSKKQKEFFDKLNYQYDYEGKKAQLKEFVNITPINIIIKNKEIVYAKIGSLSSNEIKTIVERYDIRI